MYMTKMGLCNSYFKIREKNPKPFLAGASNTFFMVPAGMPKRIAIDFRLKINPSFYLIQQYDSVLNAEVSLHLEI